MSISLFERGNICIVLFAGIDSLFKNLFKKMMGKLIILNLAATKIDKLTFNVTSKNLKETFNINTFAFLKVIQYFLPLMMKSKWGRIISFSSTGGSAGESSSGGIDQRGTQGLAHRAWLFARRKEA